MNRSLRIFSALGLLLTLAGFVLGARYLYFVLIGQGTGHVQSVILAAVLMIVGIQIILIGLLADLIGFNRKILEQVRDHLRKMDSLEKESPAQQPERRR